MNRGSWGNPCVSALRFTPVRSSFATVTTSGGQSTGPRACGRWPMVARSCARARPPSSSSTPCPTMLILSDLGMRQLKNLARAEHVFELRLETDEDESRAADERTADGASRPARGTRRPRAVRRTWRRTRTAAVRVADRTRRWRAPGADRRRTWCRQDAPGRRMVPAGLCSRERPCCTAVATRTSVRPISRSPKPCVRWCPASAPNRLRGLRGVEALLPLVPGLTDVLPDLAAPTRCGPRHRALCIFDAVVAVFEIASAGAPIVLVLDDLHWAAKPTLLLLRHLLRFGDHARMQIVGTYRSTDLDRAHPLAAMLADLHRDGTANRLISAVSTKTT